MQTSNQKITVPVLTPLSLAVLILLGSSILGGYILERRNLLHEVNLNVDGTHKLFEKYLQEDEHLMSGMIDFIVRDRQLQRIWLEKDRDELLEYSMPIFEDIRSKYKVTHFYYHDLDRTCFLRVHNPPRNGDYINRFTMQAAADRSETAWGIELGTFGTFTLRVVHPWLIDNKLVGYIELGEEIEHILPVMKEIFNVELMAMIDKEFVNRSGWEEGMRMMGREGDWDFLPDAVIADSTFENLSDKSLQNIKKVISKERTSLPSLYVGDHRYRCGFVHLVDAGDREVGRIVVMKDVTSTEAALKAFSIVLAVICVVIGLSLCLLFYVYIRRIEFRLTKLYSSLRDQIAKRRQAEKKLQSAYDQMEVKVKERTSELRNEISERKKAEVVLQEVNVKLETTIEKLTVANEELKQFAFITSHHLSEPVRKITTFADELVCSLRNKLDNDQIENLNFMMAGVDMMAQMVKGLKFYLKAATDKEEFDEIDLNVMIKQIEGADLKLDFERTKAILVLPQILPVISGCRDDIRQVLQHIIANSLKFRKEDESPKIVVKARSNDKKMARIEVVDNGTGVKAEYLKDVFKPFKRLGTEYSYEGVGIGLTVCKKIVERHGGQIGIESVYKQGTTIWFTLPLAGGGQRKEKLTTNSVDSPNQVEP